MATLQTVVEFTEAAVALAAVGSMLVATGIHILGFDKEPWAQPYLRVANDIIGAYKAKKKEGKDASNDST
jgi:hypothetical protein